MISRQNVYEYYPFVVVGVIIEKEGKILLVQEAEKDRGQWNQPAGWLDKFEDPVAAAKREGEEETGLALQITDFLGVYSFVKDKQTTDDGINRHVVKLIFVAKLLGGNAVTLPGEIMSQQWFTPEEIEKMGPDKLRDADIKDEVRDYFLGKRFPLKIVHHLPLMTQ
ncbi:NUDIX domain-containing protein [Candidatus Uhrbacteria bacterium]|nr:NUDIX domain-containing protein [Candidatus Uhrbacteria bacterium]